MTTPQYSPSEPDSLEGRVFRPASRAELAEAVEQAFDYRGDVTLKLANGAMIEGYVFNRDLFGPQGVVQMFRAGESGALTVQAADIVAIRFTGKDTASGKSWEAWVAKKEAQRRAEAEQAATEARARGHL